MTMRLDETDAAVLAAESWLVGGGIRGALAQYGLTLEEVASWSAAGRTSLRAAAQSEWSFEARYVGVVAAALILGIELGLTGGVTRA